MGGLFRSPKPVVVEASSSQSETASSAQADADTASETAAREARMKAVDRARRGLAGTIATSDRGVLDPAPAYAVRKTLLGE